MGFENIFRLINELESKGIITKKTKKIANHFSHNCNPTKENCENYVKGRDILISYDGFEIEI